MGRPAGPVCLCSGTGLSSCGPIVGLLLRVVCREHADIAGNVGIPDISVAIDGDRIGLGARPRQPEADDLPIAQPAEAAIADIPNQTDPSCATASPDNAAEVWPTGNSWIASPTSRPIVLLRYSRNQTALSGPIATSEGTEAALGRSKALIAPLVPMRTIWSPDCRLAQPVPSGATAKP